MQRPTPATQGDRHIYPVSYRPEMGHMPMGSVAANGGQLIYRKWKSSAATTGLLLGPIGVLVANQSMKSGSRNSGNRFISPLSALDMKAETASALQTLENAEKLGDLKLVNGQLSGERAFQLRPFLFLALDDNNGSELLVILRVVEQQGVDELWSGQYISFIKLDDQSSDLSLLPGEVREALQSTLTFFLADLRGELAVDSKKVVVNSNLGYVFTSGHLGYQVRPEIAGEVAFQAGGSLSSPYAGMQIHPAGSLSYTAH
ncbi:MAG: hypothetical protein KUG81_05210 [Gammaproteobacteria bacterium]|nr:hypothetical protein [Gammaproteobacteria bacterium]